MGFAWCSGAGIPRCREQGFGSAGISRAGAAQSAVKQVGRKFRVEVEEEGERGAHFKLKRQNLWLAATAHLQLKQEQVEVEGEG